MLLQMQIKSRQNKVQIQNFKGDENTDDEHGELFHLISLYD